MEERLKNTDDIKILEPSNNLSNTNGAMCNYYYE